MRFRRRPKVEAFEWTGRKLSAYLRRGERERSRLRRDYPLLGELQDEAEMPAPDLERSRRHSQALASDRQMRDLAAKHWRKGRQAYFACTRDTQLAIQAEWRRWQGPVDATYFIYVVEKHSGAQEARRRRLAEEHQQLLDRFAQEDGRQGALAFTA